MTKTKLVLVIIIGIAILFSAQALALGIIISTSANNRQKTLENVLVNVKAKSLMSKKISSNHTSVRGK